MRGSLSMRQHVLLVEGVIAQRQAIRAGLEQRLGMIAGQPHAPVAFSPLTTTKSSRHARSPPPVRSGPPRRQEREYAPRTSAAA
jgi:hypothetical protein